MNTQESADTRIVDPARLPFAYQDALTTEFQAGNSAGRPNPAKSAAANEPSQPGCASSSTVRKARIAVIRSPSNIVSTSMAAARYRPRAGSSM